MNTANRTATWVWSPYRPSSGQPWELRHAAHLYRRAAFGGRWLELEQALREGAAPTVERLLSPPAEATSFDERQAGFERGARASIETLEAWWLRRMIESPWPLGERLVWFWHGHFAIRADRVGHPPLMYDYLTVLRDHALTDYPSLLRQVVSQPAVLLALGADRNRAAQPNQRLARWLLHHLTVGPEHCTEEDVRETARALTGWAVLNNRLRFLAHEQDPGMKRILGQEQPFDRDTVIDLLAHHPATPRTLAKALCRFFISEISFPTSKDIQSLADDLARANGIQQGLRTLFLSDVFYSPEAYHQRIKSPVDYAIGMIRALEGLVPTAPLAEDLRRLGQGVCTPPSLEGWPSGRSWINTVSLTERARLAQALLAGSGRYGDRLDPLRVAQAHHDAGIDGATGFLEALLLQNGTTSTNRTQHGPASLRASDPPSRSNPEIARETACRLVTSPEYQLS